MLNKMNNIHLKKIIAREWLISLVAIFIGIIFSVYAFFIDSSEYLHYRKNLYETLVPPWEKDEIILDNPYDQFDDLHNFRKKYPQYNNLDDSTILSKLLSKNSVKSIPLISYTEFNKLLDDKSKRKIFYDSISAKYDIGDYITFENKVSQPTFYTGLSKLMKHLFSHRYWLDTLLSLLIPYLIFQFVRSVYYSIITLFKKLKPLK